MVRIVLLIAALIIIESAQWAAAQSMPCTDRAAAVRHLGTKFSEAPAARGLTNDGAVLEVLTSETGRSWTMMVTVPDGTTCLIAVGESWETLPMVAKLEPGF
jgi:hypothetical protein